MTIQSKKYAAQMLDKLIQLDHEVTGAFFEMGQILSSIQHGKLWEILGYQSFAHLVEEELSFTSNTASKYLHTYRNFKRLGYSKAEALELIRQFSFTRMTDWLAQAKQKAGKRAIANAIQKALENKRQLNFTVNADEYKVVQRALSAHGATKGESGRWAASSEAFVACMSDACKTSKQAAPKLKAVG